MSGNIHFFLKNFISKNESPVLTATSNSSLVEYILSRNEDFYWESSDTSSEETISISLDSAKKIDSIFIFDHNLAAHTIKLFLSGSEVTLTNFTEVESETCCSYYSFDSVLADRISITAPETSPLGELKKIGRVVVTELIGKLEKWPQIQNPKFDRGVKKQKTESNHYRVVTKGTNFSFKLKFKSYKYKSDIDLMLKLFKEIDPFFVWPSGGFEDTEVCPEWMRFSSLYQMKITSNDTLNFDRFIYTNGLNGTVTLQEVIE